MQLLSSVTAWFRALVAGLVLVKVVSRACTGGAFGPNVLFVVGVFVVVHSTVVLVRLVKDRLTVVV